jgi:hypothetical protein
MSGTGPSAVTGQNGQYLRLVDWVADADEWICGLWQNWRFLWVDDHTFSLVVGVREYSGSPYIPTDLRVWIPDSFVLNPTASDYKKLTEIDYGEWRSRLKWGSFTNQQPSAFTIKPDNSLAFDNPADSTADTFQAEYWKRPTRMAANTDNPNVPTAYEMAIIYRVKMWYAEFEDAPEIYKSAVQDYSAWLARLEAEQLPELGYASGQSESDVTVVVD